MVDSWRLAHRGSKISKRSPYGSLAITLNGFQNKIPSHAEPFLSHTGIIMEATILKCIASYESSTCFICIVKVSHCCQCIEMCIAWASVKEMHIPTSDCCTSCSLLMYSIICVCIYTVHIIVCYKLYHHGKTRLAD